MRSFRLTEAEKSRYGLVEDKHSRWLEPYPGCWRSVEGLKQGDVSREENPELIRKLGRYKVPGV